MGGAENADEGEKGFEAGGQVYSTHASPGSNRLLCAFSGRPSSGRGRDLESRRVLSGRCGSWFSGGVSSVSFEGFWTEDGSCAIVLGFAGTRYHGTWGHK